MAETAAAGLAATADNANGANRSSAALVVLSNGSKLIPEGTARRIADSGWELSVGGKRLMVRDADLWFSEAALPLPEGLMTRLQPLPVSLVLPDGGRLEAQLMDIRLEQGAVWMHWHRNESEREVRISDSGLAGLELILRAPGVPRLPTPEHKPSLSMAPAAANQAGPVNAAAPVEAQANAVGLIVLDDGGTLTSDTTPQQLSDGSWHVTVNGHTQVLTAEQVWLVETDTMPPVALVAADPPVPMSVALPRGQRLSGELLTAYVDSNVFWGRWRRGNREFSLHIAARGVAGVDCKMRSPRLTELAAGPVGTDRLPLLRNDADLDAFLDAQLRSDGKVVERHLFADFDAWQHCTADTRGTDVAFQLAHRLGLALIDLTAVDPSPSALSSLSPDTARRCRMVPLRIRQNLIAVATDNPTDNEALSIVDFVTGRRVVLLLAHSAAVHAALTRCYDRVEDSALLKSLTLSAESAEEDNEKTVRENERLAHQQPIVQLVSALIEDAARRRASDIHIRPRAEDFEVLLRIDGGLLPVRTFAKPLLRAVVSRIKIIAGMNIAEHRLPQDGRIAFPFEGVDIDIRVSVLPSVNGESIVMRLLNSRDGLRSLAQIGFNPQDEAIFRDLLARSHGMILVTGPTGCGKSTTLYSALLEARKQDVNIITVEDPVEYHIPDVTQIQINTSIGFSFATTLRNILRHDPDVVMLGEIRDRESAEIAVESALTGHLLLSTLHTNSAATTITRLIDLGVEAFLLRSTLLGVLAQRLARRNCRQCMEPERFDPYIRATLGVGENEVFYRGIGCRHCSGTGVHGRTAVYELMTVNSDIRKLIVSNVDGDAIHAAAVANGMVPITERALALARAGVISLREAYRIRVE